jgi:D-beta-D-heptose 7-phosphate kinase / D-beta-D-heptose 1-phosphate adenosyltransferase
MMDIYKLLNNKNKILLYGDLIIDLYTEVKSNRISSECDIPVYERCNDDNKYMLGGAANVLNNLLNFNIQTHLISIVENKYIDTIINSTNLIGIKDDNYKNIIKQRFFSRTHHCFRIDDKNDYKMNKEVITLFKNKIQEILSNYDMVIISDYNTGIVHEEVVTYLIDSCNKLNIKTLIDPKNNYNMYVNCSIIKPNKQDAELFVNFKINSIEDAIKAGNAFLQKLNAEICIITMGSDGCIYIKKNYETEHIKCEMNENSHVLDVTGAGDTFVSGICLGLLHNLNINEICKLCNIFCSDVIQRKYVSVVNIYNVLLKHNAVISDINDCITLKKYLKNKKVIFTSGCFDILHDGHIHTLKNAKKLGDTLIVALNTDSSIKKLKGNSRPINSLKTRVDILSSIKEIDFIIIFSDETPNSIFEILQPDILVKGGDYSADKIKGIFPGVKEYISIPLIRDISTTKIIERIK